MFICSSCSLTYATREAAFEHVASCSSTTTTYLVCCGRSFPTEALLSRHVAYKHPESLFSKYGGDLLDLDTEPVPETRQPNLHWYGDQVLVVARRRNSNVYEVARSDMILGKHIAVYVFSDYVGPVWC